MSCNSNCSTSSSSSAVVVVPVIDPMNRNGKVSIDMKLITETRGLVEYMSTPVAQRKDLSLCLLYQKGRCNAGARCHQIHACPEFITKVRAQVAVSNNCCAAHGDVFSTTYAKATQVVTVVTDGVGVDYSLSAFARTEALELVLSKSKTASLKVPANKICRLHGQNRCKFGQDCKNVHLCRHAKPLDSAAKRATPPPPADFFAELGSNRTTELGSMRSDLELPSMRSDMEMLSTRSMDSPFPANGLTPSQSSGSFRCAGDSSIRSNFATNCNVTPVCDRSYRRALTPGSVVKPLFAVAEDLADAAPVVAPTTAAAVVPPASISNLWRNTATAPAPVNSSYASKEFSLFTESIFKFTVASPQFQKSASSAFSCGIDFSQLCQDVIGSTTSNNGVTSVMSPSSPWRLA